MDATVWIHAVIVNTKFVPQKMVYAKKAVHLDGRVTHVIKVVNNVSNILLFYFLWKKYQIYIYKELRRYKQTRR